MIPPPSRLPDEALAAFLDHCYRKVGEAYFRTPRNTIRAFLDLLAVLDQNRQASWRDLLGGIELASEGNPDLPISGNTDTADDELASFKDLAKQMETHRESLAFRELDSKIQRWI